MSGTVHSLRLLTSNILPHVGVVNAVLSGAIPSGNVHGKIADGIFGYRGYTHR